VEPPTNSASNRDCTNHLGLNAWPLTSGWSIASGVRAAMVALHLSGVVFRRHSKPPQLQPWEGPFRIRRSGFRNTLRWPHSAAQ